MPKKIVVVFALVLVSVAAGLLWLRGNLDGLVRDAIAKYGSAMTQAAVTVGGVEIRSSDGTGLIRDLSIGNPAGFKTPHAFKVGEIEVAIDIASVTRDVILVRRIAIKAPDIIYEKGEVMTNFDAIEKNVATYLGPAEKSSEGGKKLIVEELLIRDAKAHASAPFLQGKTLTVNLPDISLHNIGKAKGGVPPGELGRAVVQAVKQKLSSSISFDNLAKSVGQTLDRAGSVVKGLLGK
jgi:hypothetical protein